MTDVLQASLTGGELSPTLFGHVDLARYQTSLKQCRNFLVRPYGGIQNRAGFRHVAAAKNSAATQTPRLIPFKVSETLNFILEFGHLYIRIFKLGAQVLNGGVPVEITSSPYTISEVFSLQFAQSVDVMTLVHPNHAPMDLSYYSDTNWTLVAKTLKGGPFQTVNTDSTVTISASGSVGGVTLTSNKAIFTAANVGQLLYLEQKDFGTAWQPGVAITIGAIVRSVGNYYQAMNTGTTGTNIPVGTSENWSDGGVVWKYLHNGYGVVQIQGPIVAPSATCTAQVVDGSYIPDSITTSGGAGAYGAKLNVTGWSGSAGNKAAATCPAHGAAIGYYGTGLINWASGGDKTYGMQVKDSNTIICDLAYSSYSGAHITTTDAPTIQLPAAAGGGATWKWAWGSFGDPTIGGPGYPAAITYYQQRLVLAGTPNQPDTIWMSGSNAFGDFSVSNPILDSDAVTFTLGSGQMNMVRSMLQLSKLLVITSGSVWAVGQGQGDIITPLNIPCVMQGYSGGSTLPPVGIAYSTLYVHDKGNLIRELNYQFMTDNYVGTDLTVFAHHLVEGYQIVDWAWQQTPLMVVWCVRSDGKLLAMTYMKEQEVVGWTQHDTNGKFISVCSVTEGTEDVLYASVNRTINGASANFIERLDTRLVTDITDAFFVDCGTTFDGSIDFNTQLPYTQTLTITGGSTWGPADNYLTVTASASTFTGQTDVDDELHFTAADGTIVRLKVMVYQSATKVLVVPDRTIPVGNRGTAISGWAWARNQVQVPWLPNTQVMALVDGNVQGPVTTDASGWATLSPCGYKVQVGLQYISDAVTLPLAPASPDSIVGNAKMITMIHVLTYEGREIWAGPDENHLYQAKTRDVVTGTGNAPANLITDKLMIQIDSTWDDNGTTLLRHTGPTPIGINALIPEMILGQT